MTRSIAIISTLLLLLISTAAQKPQSSSALKEMVETEQAFSKAAEVKGTRQAFMEFIADDGLLFRPRAVNGKKWMNEHPVPASDKRPLLAWQPAFAGIADAGDLGFTTGPWEFKDDIKDVSPSGFGHFVTLWKKQNDSSWKFVLDLGISHPQSAGPLTIWKVEKQTQRKPAKTVNITKAAEVLIARDRSYASLAAQSHSKAFLKYAAPDARLYLPNNFPFIGRAPSAAVLPMNGVMRYQAIAADVSRSDDLGYTHGTYEEVSAEDQTKVIKRGNYLRIWKKQQGIWQIVLDVTNPVP